MLGLPPHFFRHESGRLVSVLVRVFGVHNLALAQDVAQDVLCRALEVWKLGRLPDNPSAWLLAAARNRATDALRRERTARTWGPEFGRLLESEWTLKPLLDEVFDPGAIQDDELRMMFSICQPRLSEEAQIAMVLHTLCGFGVDEIAAAFLASPAAIEKRLTRARKSLARTPRLFQLTDEDLPRRLDAVHRALYLLFNEGYHGASPDAAVREDLCREALRVVRLLSENAHTATPATHALAALMLLHAARLPARVSEEGRLRSLFDQDRSLWDRELIAQGLALLERSASGTELSEHHLEAAIAAHHVRASDRAHTPWREIVGLYDVLLRLNPSPVVELSRAIALAELDGPQRGLDAIHAMAGRARLARYPFLEAAQGELLLRCAQPDQARPHFEAALALARNPMERDFFAGRLAACAQPGGHPSA